MDTKRLPKPNIYRAKKTLEFVGKWIYPAGTILDIGEPNFVGTYIATKLNRSIKNTNCDLDYSINPIPEKLSTIFCFEVLEHLLNPRIFLDNCHHISAKDCQMFLSYPSRPKLLWNNLDHFHEYDQLRFKYLLDKTGWKIVSHERIRLIYGWKDFFKYLCGIRPFLRLFYDYTEIYELRKKY